MYWKSLTCLTFDIVFLIFFCLQFFLLPFPVVFMSFLAQPENLECSSCLPLASCIFLTKNLISYMVLIRSILSSFQHSKVCVSDAYRKLYITREHTSLILIKRHYLIFQCRFNCCYGCYGICNPSENLGY